MASININQPLSTSININQHQSISISIQQREEVEGPLFIVERYVPAPCFDLSHRAYPRTNTSIRARTRHGSPSYQYVILNRLGIDNTVNSITNSLKFVPTLDRVPKLSCSHHAPTHDHR